MGGGDWESNVEQLGHENELLAAADIRNYAAWENDIMNEEDDEDADEGSEKEPE